MKAENWLPPVAVVFGMLLLASPDDRQPEAPVRVLSVTTASWCKPCQKLKKDIEEHPEIVEGVEVEFIEDDELVEITPKSIRLRKRHLKEHDRKRASRTGA